MYIIYPLRQKKLLIGIILIFINGLGAYSQVIKGRVLESATVPIPYATIEIVNNQQGVISNDEGSFSINITNTNLDSSIQISCLGYKKRIIPINEFSSKDYFLEIEVNQLPEVILTNEKLSVNSILKNVKKNLTHNYKTNSSEYRIFTRRTEQIKGKQANFKVKKSTGFKKSQLNSFNKDFDLLENSLIENSSKQYTDLVGDLKILNDTTTKMQIHKAVRLYDKNNEQTIESLFNQGNKIVLKHIEKNKIYKVKSGFFTVSDSISLDNKQQQMNDTINAVTPVKNGCHYFIKEHSFLGDEPELNFISNQEIYDYTLEEVTYLDQDMVYVISFIPNRKKAKYTGTLYISNDNFAVLKMEYRYFKNRAGNKLNLKFLLGIKYAERNKKGFAVYKQNTDGYYYPNYISEEIDRYFYAKRPFKFIEKIKQRRGKRTRVSFDFLIEGVFTAKSEFLVISKKTLNHNTYHQFEEPNKIDYQTPNTYDSSYWKDFIVIEPLEEMKSFDK